MNEFTYAYPVTVYFGEKAASNHLPEATPQFARMATEVWGIDPEGKTELEQADESEIREWVQGLDLE